MERIILIETSTALCSTALSEDGAIVSYRESSAPKAHASLTAVFIAEMLKERGITIDDCDAVCVSMGPGSYTGLRVGVSTAKGLCFGSRKPLLAVGTLDTLVAQATTLPADIAEAGSPTQFRHIIPMVDARRMEVYTAVFSQCGPQADDCGIPGWRQVTDTAPAIIDENSFAEYLAEGPVLFIGDGAGKCADVIRHPNARFVQCCPKASSMPGPALAEFRKGSFRDVAYFEPFYLKDFVATVSRKKLW